MDIRPVLFLLGLAIGALAMGLWMWFTRELPLREELRLCRERLNDWREPEELV